MPTDVELRTLFRESPAPDANIDPATIIRRSRRRRLPQQLGVGGVLTLAVAGIGFASFTGLQGLSPSMTAADAPVSVAENGPFAGTDLSARDTCAAPSPSDADVNADLEAVSEFPTTAAAGQSVHGTLTLTNTGTQPVVGTVTGTAVTLAGAGAELHQSDSSAAGTSVSLQPGESMGFDLTYVAVGCDASGNPDGEPLEAGSYEMTATLTLVSADGTQWRVGAPASVITIR